MVDYTGIIQLFLGLCAGIQRYVIGIGGNEDGSDEESAQPRQGRLVEHPPVRIVVVQKFHLRFAVFTTAQGKCIRFSRAGSRSQTEVDECTDNHADACNGDESHSLSQCGQRETKRIYGDIGISWILVNSGIQLRVVPHWGDYIVVIMVGGRRGWATAGPPAKAEPLVTRTAMTIGRRRRDG